MKPLQVLFCHILIVYAIVTPLRAQVNLKDHEFYLSEGILSNEQFRGLLFIDKPVLLIDYKDLPYTVTGASFLTYRHHYLRRFAFGITFGIDNQVGNLTTGPWGTNLVRTVGRYKRNSWTLALESSVSYYRKPWVEAYGYIGIGYTDLTLNYSFFDYHANYGRPFNLVPENPYTVEVRHLNWLVTPIGWRFGRDFAGFFEFGIGYKGLFSGGLSFRIKGKEKPTLPLPDFLILPCDYSPDSNCSYRGKVKTGSPPHYDRHADFPDQVEMLKEKMSVRHANILRIYKVSDATKNGRNYYSLKGKAFYTSCIDSVRTKVMRDINSQTAGKPFALFTFYNNCAAYVRITINDTVKIHLRGYTKAVLKVSKECTVHVYGRHYSQGYYIDAKLGSHFYFHCFRWPLTRKSVVQLVDELRGAVECDVIKYEKNMEL